MLGVSAANLKVNHFVMVVMKKTDHKPIVFKSDTSKEVALCGCKQSKNAPYCDGTHLTL